MFMITLQELLSDLSPQKQAEAQQALTQHNSTALPWYLQFLIGLGAWLASLFFLGAAFTVMGWDPDPRIRFGFIGIIFLLITIGVARQKLGIFVNQACVAFNLAAQAMIYFGFAPDTHHVVDWLLFIALLQAVLHYLTYPDFLVKFLTTIGALQFALLWLSTNSDGEPWTGQVSLVSSVLMLLFWIVLWTSVLGIFLRPKNQAYFAPLGYALVTFLALWKVEDSLGVWSFFNNPVTDSASILRLFVWLIILAKIRASFTSLILFFLIVWAAGGRGALQARPIPFLATAVALMVLFLLGAQGVTLALLFLLLGFSLQNKPILFLGLLFLPIYITDYYYNLAFDLLLKSGVLMGSGAVLLALRSMLLKWFDSKEVIS